MLKEVNHFFYELERNPLGIIVHCVELMLATDETSEKWSGYWQHNTHRGDMQFDTFTCRDNQIQAIGEDEVEEFCIRGTYDNDGNVKFVK